MQPIVIDIETVAIADAETYLEPVKAPDNYKDPEKIAAYEKDAHRKQVDRASLDVDLLRIIALGVAFPRCSTEVRLVRDFTETDILTWFWEQWDKSAQVGSPQLVTYNGLGFDIPALLRRSLYLGVHAPYIKCDKYKHPQVIDVQAILSMDGKLTWRSLQFYLQRFGYPHAGTDISGSEVGERFAAGDWTAIGTHCRMDVDATKWLAERIGVIPRLQPLGVPEAVGAF